MIFDCFSFFNELDLLEIRLNELNSTVDRFVLVEATKTFQKKAKPLFFEENKQRFAPFLPKITHIVVHDYPTFWTKFRNPTPWDYDDHQKDQVVRALSDCQSEDVIIFSDLDEIPSPAKIRENQNHEGVSTFEQRHFYYFLNCVEVEKNNSSIYAKWYGSTMTKFKNFESVRKLRVQREINKFSDTYVIKDGGWHFAYLGGVEKIIQKMESYAHTEHNKIDFKNPAKIKELIESGCGLYENSDIKCIFESINDSYPAYLQSNILQFSHLIKK